MTTSKRYIDKPIFILGCNRSGTTLHFKNLSSHPEVWSLYIESQSIFYHHYPPDDEKGDRVQQHSSKIAADEIENYFWYFSNNKEFFKETPLLRFVPEKLLQRPVSHLCKRAPIRVVDKTPSNCLRVPLLKGMFPDAKFIFIIRRPEDVISSLMEGWKNWTGVHSGPWSYSKWHYLLPEGWQSLKKRSLQEICAFQWIRANKSAWANLNGYCGDDFLFLRHEDIMSDPKSMYKKILDYCELPRSEYLDRLIEKIDRRVFTTGGSPPQHEKWKKLHFHEVESVRHLFEPLKQYFYPNR